MSYFSNLLAGYSKRIGLNSPQIARYCGLDRVTVYRFIKGKTLPKDKETVFNMAEILQLTEDEKDSLVEAYDCTRLGFRAYWEKKYIRNFMRSFSGKNPASPMVQYEVEDIRNPYRDALLVSGKDATLKRIQMELLRECDKQQGRIELIMRPGIASVMDMLLSAGKKNKALQVKHLIPITTAFLSTKEQGISFGSYQAAANRAPFDSSSSLGSPVRFWDNSAMTDVGDPAIMLSDEGYPGGNPWWDHELLQSFFKIVSLCAEGFEYEPYYCYSRLMEFSTFPLYTNLLVTKKATILFTDDLGESILFIGKDQIASFHEKFQRIADGKPALSYTYRDVASFMENMNNVILKRERRKDDTEFFYSSQPCLIPIMTEELMKKHLRTDVFSSMPDGFDHVLKNIFNYVGTIRARYVNADYNQINYLSENGIRYFLRTGRFAEVPLEMYSPLVEEERREMLLKLAEQEGFKYRITREELSPPDGMLCIEVMEKALFLEFLVPGKGMCFLYINEPGILLAFRNFFTSLSEEDLYSEAESREILRQIAAEKL